MTVGYIRVSTDTQVTSNQKNEILNYAHELHVKVDKFIDVTMSSRKNMRDRLIDDLFTSLSGKNGGTWTPITEILGQ